MTFRNRLARFEFEAVSSAALWFGIGAGVVVFLARINGWTP